VARSNGIIRLSWVERASITIPNDIIYILVGIILGDGHIVKIALTNNSKLIYTQTTITHKKYFYFIYNIFIPFSTKNHIPKLKLIKNIFCQINLNIE